MVRHAVSWLAFPLQTLPKKKHQFLCPLQISWLHSKVELLQQNDLRLKTLLTNIVTSFDSVGLGKYTFMGFRAKKQNEIKFTRF